MPLRNVWKSVKLGFQKLDTLFLNDLKLFMRDRKALILVALTPFLILSILINLYSFSEVAENIKGVRLGICDQGNANIDLESDIFELIRFQGNCEEDVELLVKRGDLRAGLVIPQDFRDNLMKGKGTELTMYLDNSKPTTALVSDNAIKAYASDLNQKMGEAFIREAWKNLDELNDNLRLIVKNLKTAEPAAREMKKRMGQARQEIEKVDFEAYQLILDDMIYYLDLSKDLLAEAEKSSGEIDPGLVMPNLPNVSNKNYSENTTLFFKSYKTQSQILKETYCNSTIPNPGCTLIYEADSLMLELETEIEGHYSDINQKVAELNEQSRKLDEAIEDLQKVLDSSSEQNKEMREDIAQMQTAMILLQENAENLTETMDRLDRDIDDFLTDMIRLRKDLENTIEVLDSYTQKDPATILRPVTVKTRQVFPGKEEIFNRLPGLMAIVLLFIILFISASQIVGERKGGTMARIFLSPLSMFFWVFEKMLYLLMLSLIAILSMVLSVVIFGVGVSFSPELVLVAVMGSLVYITIGMLIGAVSKSENTSLLTCLVVGFPLMFLSGAFSPPELMSRVWRVVAQYLPLSINISALERIMIYGTGIDWAEMVLMAGMTLIFYILTVLMIKKKPTLK